MVVNSVVIALSRMKESIRRRRLVVMVPRSRVLLCILHNLYQDGLLGGFKICGRNIFVFFKYVNGCCVIKDLNFYCRKSLLYNVNLKKL